MPLKESAQPRVPLTYEGVPIVIGHRSVAAKYSNRPWREVQEAARRGDDGLRLTNETALRDRPPDGDMYWQYAIPRDHFALRAITTMTRGVVGGLLGQNYSNREA